MSALTPRGTENWLARTTQWLRDRGEAFAACRELDNCGDAARLAQDCGISLSDLRAIASKGPDAAQELTGMLKALNIDPDVLDRFQPAVMRDLQAHCCLCGSKAECREDQAAGEAAHTYGEYCVNAATLDALKKG